jgi:hypothetical protein
MARFFSLVPEAAAIVIFATTYLVVAIGQGWRQLRLPV